MYDKFMCYCKTADGKLSKSTVHALVKKGFEKRQTLNFLISRMLFIVMGHLVDPGLQDFQLNVHFSTAKTSNKIEILQNFERPFTPRGWVRSA